MMPSFIDEAIPVWGMPSVQPLSAVNSPANMVLLTEASGSRIFSNGDDTVNLSGAALVAAQCQAVYLIAGPDTRVVPTTCSADGHAKRLRAHTQFRPCRSQLVERHSHHQYLPCGLSVRHQPERDRMV